MARKPTVLIAAQRDPSAQYREAAKDAARKAEAQEWSEGLACFTMQAGA